LAQKRHSGDEDSGNHEKQKKMEMFSLKKRSYRDDGTDLY